MEKKLPKTIQSKEGLEHFSVGAIIMKDKKILLMDRKLKPFGFAGIAGHIDEREIPSKALKRELKEETNLDLHSCKLILKRKIIQKENCVFGVKKHFWYVYIVGCSGELKPSQYEVKSINYVSREKIKKLYKEGRLDYAWVVIFKKLGII
ncbi:MAG: NUDIX hydrolase [Patescibacteria group bacterium]